MQHIAVFGSAQGIRWRLNHIHSMKYAEVISASIAATSAGIDYSCCCVRNARLVLLYSPPPPKLIFPQLYDGRSDAVGVLCIVQMFGVWFLLSVMMTFLACTASALSHFAYGV